MKDQMDRLQCDCCVKSRKFIFIYIELVGYFYIFQEGIFYYLLELTVNRLEIIAATFTLCSVCVRTWH